MLYRARVVQPFANGFCRVLIPQVYGDTLVTVTRFGSASLPLNPGMGWVSFEGTGFSYPVWVANDPVINTTPVDPTVYDPPVSISSATPPTGTFVEGDLWFDPSGPSLYVYVGGTWEVAFTSSSSSGGSSVTVSDAPPVATAVGDQWYDSSTGKLYLWYDSFWVQVGGGYTSTSFGIVAVSGQGDVVAEVATDTLNIVGANGLVITTTPATDTVTFTAPSAFGTIAVSGQSDVNAEVTNDTLTLVAGNGGLAITTNAATDTVTFSPYGAIICTSGTRPTGIPEGTIAYETDTNYYICFVTGTTWALMHGTGSDTTNQWNNVTLGTGGTSLVEWSYNGTVDGGVLTMSAQFVLGTGGALTASAATVSFPTGFTADGSLNAVTPFGHVYVSVASGGGMGYCRRGTAVLSPLIQGAAGTYLGTGSFLTSSIPGVWASGDGTYLQASIRGTFTV